MEKSTILNNLPMSSSQAKEISENKKIIVKILLHLPMKDLVRFQCVSKLWLSTISHPLFGHNYSLYNSTTNTLIGILLYQLRRRHHPIINFVFFCGPQTMKKPFHSLNFANQNSDIQRIWSCNGLFLISVISYETSNNQSIIADKYTPNYYICNPTTNKSTKIPDLKRPIISNLLSINLAFDPKKSMYYKVVCVWICEGCYRFSVYSSKTRIWEDSKVFIKVGNDDCFLFKEGVFWNNAVNWVSISGPFMCFDVDGNRPKFMPTTPIYEGKTRRCIEYFGESFGCLHLVEAHGVQENLFDIFELKKEYFVWCLRHRVDMSKMSLRRRSWSGNRYGGNILSVILSEKKQDDDINILVSTSRGLFMLHLSGNDVGPIVPCCLHHYEERLHEYRWYHAHRFIMSLSPV